MVATKTRRPSPGRIPLTEPATARKRQIHRRRLLPQSDTPSSLGRVTRSTRSRLCSCLGRISSTHMVSQVSEIFATFLSAHQSSVPSPGRPKAEPSLVDRLPGQSVHSPPPRPCLETAITTAGLSEDCKFVRDGGVAPSLGDHASRQRRVRQRGRRCAFRRR